MYKLYAINGGETTLEKYRGLGEDIVNIMQNPELLEYSNGKVTF